MTKPRLLDADKVLEAISIERAEHEKLYAAHMKQGRRNFALQHETVAAILGIVADRIRSLPSQCADTPGEVERLRGLIRDVLRHPQFRPCECGAPTCLTSMQIGRAHV